MGMTQTSPAADWELEPTLTVGTILTDNVDRNPPGEEDGDVVLEATPGLSARRQGGRLRTNLVYRLQGRVSLSGDQQNVDNFLRSNATAELYRDRVFLDANASISQVIVSADRSTSRNTVFDNNRTTTATYSLSPYWISRFGNYADSRVRYRFSDVLFEDDDASDSRLHTLTANLNSGPRFTNLLWDMDYSYRFQERQEGNDDSRQTFQARAGYPLTDELAAITRLNYRSADVSTARRTEDGLTWEIGLRWQPSRYFEAAFLYGDDEDNEFRVRFSPTTRTDLEVRRRERSTGVNPGVRWSGRLTHRTRLSTWSLRYTEESTNVQTLIAGAPAFDDEGNPIDDPGSDLSLTDEEFLRRRFDAAVTYRLGRSRFRIGSFYEDREFAQDRNDESRFGANASWNRRLTPRTNADLRLDWDHIDTDNEADEWDIQARLSRRLGRDLNASLQYGYFRRDADQDGGEYRENRLTMRLNMNF